MVVRPRLLAELADLIGLQAGERMDELAEDFLRGFLGDFLDVHAAFGGGDDDRLAGLAVQQDGEVELRLMVHGLGDHHLADEAAGLAGLFGDERLAEHLGGHVAGGFRRIPRDARRP